MKDFSPIFTIESEDFGEAELEALCNVVTDGKDITFGSRDEPKSARDSVHVITLTGNAIAQIERGELSELTAGSYTLGPLASQDYKNEWDRQWFEEYEKIPADSKRKFTYVYIGRLLQTYGDQLAELRDILAESIDSGVVSNRHQVITWDPRIDMRAGSPPCFQRAWIRYYEPGLIDLHLSWRSRDLYNAWRNNLIGAIAGLNKEVFFPNNVRIGRLVDMIDSLHIMHGALSSAEEVLRKAALKNPNLMKRFNAD